MKPGVCTSTTRPASPYDGQVVYETDTDRVVAYNGAAWQTVGGLAVVKAETAFTTASSITADNVFSTTYNNYLLIVRYTSTTGSSIAIKMRVGGVSASTNYNIQNLSVTSTTVTGARYSSQTSFNIGEGSGGSFISTSSTTINGPALAEPTSFISLGNTSNAALTAPYMSNNYGNHSTATAYDGIEIFPGSGTMTGTYTIYGLAK